MSGGSGKTYLILVLFLLFFSNNGRSENDFQTVDRLTLAYFNEGKWDSVITIGKSALKDHIDYYYLRLRMGISYFHLEKYYPATEHLNKAIAFNSSDPLAYTYLYQAYLRTGRTQEAKRVQRFVPDQKPDSSVLKKYLEWIYAEGGPMLSSDDGRMPGTDLYGNDSIYGEEDLYGNSYYGFMGLKVHASPVVSFNLNYTYFDFKKIKNLQYGYFEEHLDSTGQFWWGHQNYYSFHKITGQEHFEYHVHQHEFHLGSEILLKNQLSINPAVHLVYDK
ncbi:MAG: tetratricopeptide repeat protein, partial [Syntrophothermus sp.]